MYKGERAWLAGIVVVLLRLHCLVLEEEEKVQQYSECSTLLHVCNVLHSIPQRGPDVV